MKKCKILFQQSYLSFQALYGWTTPMAYLLIKVLNPIFQLCFFCLIDRMVYSGEDLARYVLSNAIVLCSYNCVFGVGNTLIEERYGGTLKTIVVCPSDNMVTFLHRSIIHIFDSMITVVVGLIAGIVIFHADFSQIRILDLSLVLVVGIISATAMGLFLSSIGLITDNMNMICNLIAMGFLVFTGANYPLDHLPVLLQKLSLCLPLTRSIQMGEKLLNNESLSSISKLLVGELSLGVIYTFLGFLLMRVCEKIAIHKGTLDLF